MTSVSGRTCATCGAEVGVLADRCPDCGGDPDLKVIELGGGYRRPAVAAGTTGRWRGWAPLVAVVAVAWGVLALAGGVTSSDPPAPPTTLPAPGVDATSPVVPPSTGQVPPTVAGGAGVGRGVRTGLVLVAAGPAPHLVDLDTGVAVAMDASDVLAVTQRGLLVVTAGGTAIWPPPYDGQGAVPFTTGGPVDRAWAVAEGTQLWTVRHELGGGGRLRLLNLAGSVLLDQALPPEANVVGALDRGLVLDAPGGTLLVDGQGRAHLLSTGFPLAVGASSVYVVLCDVVDDAVECRYEILDARGQQLGRSLGRDAFVGPVALGPGPRLAHVMGPDAERSLAIDGHAVAALGASGADGMAWSPDGRWLVASTAGRILVVDTWRAGPPVVVDVGDRGPLGPLLVASD
jgi:hypothetical protein